MLQTLSQFSQQFKNSKVHIIEQWVSSPIVIEILNKHNVDTTLFKTIYASGVFNYFIKLMTENNATQENCPVMLELLEYLKDYNIQANELFSVCTNFKKAMLDFTYDSNFNSKEVFDAITYIFDNNFTGLLNRYTQTIYLAQKEVEKASQAREYFLSNMSHEIRTPLNAILGFVKILKEEENSLTHQKYLDIIENSSESLMHIINDILDFSKLRSGEFSIDKKPFNIHEELAYTLELFVANVKEKSQTLHSFINPDIAYEIIVDGLRVKQILSNFLSNAIKFTPVNGKIKVRVECENNILSIAVSDNGIGLSKKNQEKIFNAFAQVNPDDITEGTGLGLAICAKLATLMGGQVHLQSELNVGSTFTLKIPIKESSNTMHQHYDVSLFQRLTIGLLQSSSSVNSKIDFLQKYWNSFQLNIVDVYEIDEDSYDLLFFVESEIDDATRNILIHERTPSIALMSHLDNKYDKTEHITPLYFPLYCSKLYEGFLDALNLSSSTDTNIVSKAHQRHYQGHILVAEDNDANQELIKAVLEKFSLSYYIASNGVEAFETFLLSSFDLILMDEQMPHQNGSETTAKILAYEKLHSLKHTPIVALTANVLEGVKEHCLQVGYDDFLTKPLNVKALDEVFQHYLQEIRSSELHCTLAQQDYVIHGVNFEKLSNDLQLTPSEISTLLQAYITKSQALMKELRLAVRQKNFANIEKISHSLKGSSANFRLSSIQEYASNMESASRDQLDFEYEHTISKIELELATIYIT